VNTVLGLDKEWEFGDKLSECHLPKLSFRKKEQLVLFLKTLMVGRQDVAAWNKVLIQSSLCACIIIAT
jgi:hypothetical protein